MAAVEDLVKEEAFSASKVSWMLPPWTGTLVPVYEFELPEPTPSNNVIKNMHWQAYRTLRRAWQLKVFMEGVKGRRPASPIQTAALLIERYSAGSLDWDNAYGGLKPLLDCLVAPSPKNPDGLGLILDDSPKHMPYPPLLLQYGAKRGEAKTRVRIFDLNTF